MKYRIFKCIDTKPIVGKTRFYDNTIGLEIGSLHIGKKYNDSYYDHETIEFYGKMPVYLMSNFEEIDINDIVFPPYEQANYNNKVFVHIEIIKLISQHPEMVNIVIKKHVNYINDNDYFTSLVYEFVDKLIEIVKELKAKIIESEVDSVFAKIMEE